MEKRENWSPIYFLSALGAGGLSVSFYMYLMFLVPHKSAPLATFDYIYAAVIKGGWLSVVSVLSVVLVFVFAVLHFKLLIWNTKQYNIFKTSEAYTALKQTNAEVTLMALPLTFAMTINVCFILGAVYVPGLWGIVEYLFPFALIGFAVVGYYALTMFSNYFTRLLVKGDFDMEKNNNLSQMISIFAFVMVGVGFAAPGAMSHYIAINAIGIFGAIFFTSIAILLLTIKLILGFKGMLRYGVSIENSPSLWIIIPILTLIGITMVRVTFGLHHHFEQSMDNSSLFTLTSTVLSLQIIFGILGYKVMKSLGYFDTYIKGEKKSPISFALICPGVAFVVFGMFFINFGLMANGVYAKYSLFYFLSFLPFMFVQYKTVEYFFKLKKKFDI